MRFEIDRLEQRRLLSGIDPSQIPPEAQWIHPIIDPRYREGSIQTINSRPTAVGGAAPLGYTPAEMRAAYGVDNIKFGNIVGDGTGQTIGIVDAYDLPTALSDLQAFDAHFGLPDPPSFQKLNQFGQQSPLPGTDPNGAGSPFGTWEEEESLDLQWAHAMAPKASIILFEGTNNATFNLYTTVDTARRTTGVDVISMSFGSVEFAGETNFDSTFTTPTGHQGVTFVASTGDQGAFFPGTTTITATYPAASPNVVAVGGTTLSISGTSYGGESGWGNGTASGVSGGGGGGISAFENQPTYQRGIVTQSDTQRTYPDVAMNADPATGVPIYDSWDFDPATPWFPGQVGGTSLASPMFAGLVSIADQGRTLASLNSLDGPNDTLPRLYQLPGKDYHDVTTGDNGFSAGPGYDLVTGRGSPVADSLVPDLTGPFIGNKVFNDTNVNGIQDDTNGVSGVTVNLRTLGIDGVIGTADDITVSTTTTDSNGDYGFSQMAPGNYYVHFATPLGFHISPPLQGGNAATDSNPDTITGNTGTIVVTAATWDPTIDCGMYLKSITISDASVVEGNSGVTAMRFVVTLAPANDTGVAVSFTTSDGTARVSDADYAPVSGTLIFAPGVLSQTIFVNVTGDTNIELDETFFVNITPPTGFQALKTQGTGTIINDDFPVATVSSFTATRPGSGTINYPFFITLSAPAPFPVSVPYTTIDNTAVQGSDFLLTTGTLVFPPGTTSAPAVNVVVLGGTNPQLDKTFFLQIQKSSTENVGNPSQGVGTILTNSPPAVSALDGSVTESLTGLAYLPFNVTVGPALSAPVSVDFTTVDGTAVAGLDYAAQSGTLTFRPGQIEQTVMVPIFRRFITSGDHTKTLSLTLSNIVAAGTPPIFARAVATGTVQDQQVVTLPFSGAHRVSFTDYLDHKVTVQLKGQGGGDVVFLGSSSTSTDAYEIVLGGTNADSALLIKTGGGQTSFRNILVTGPLASVMGKTTNLLGELNVSGGLGSATLNFVQTGTITVGSLPGESVAFNFSRVLDTSITSQMPIRSIVAAAYLNTDNVPDVITAPSVGTVKVKGNFGGTIVSQAVASLNVGGAILNASVRTGGNIGSVVAASITGSTIFAGVRDDLGTLPASADDFVNKSATITRVKVKSAGGFSNTLVAGWKVGKVSLGSVQTAAGGAAFGVSGGNLTSVQAFADAKINVSALDDPDKSLISNNFFIRSI